MVIKESQSNRNRRSSASPSTIHHLFEAKSMNFKSVPNKTTRMHIYVIVLFPYLRKDLLEKKRLADIEQRYEKTSNILYQ